MSTPAYTASPTARHPMLPLTSLRFVAALMVVVYHMNKLAAEHWPVLPAHAVSLFFALSGLVLQAAYGGDLRGMHPAAFLGRRLARVWPLHAFLVVGLVLLLPGWTQAADHAWRALSLTQAWSSDGGTFFWAANAASWSLSAEAFFYAAFPFLTAAVRRHPAVMAMAAVVGLVVYVTITGDTGSARGNFAAYYVDPLGRLPEFILGMCTAEALPALRRLRLRTASWTAVELAAVLILLAVNALCQAGLPWLHLHAGAGWAAWVQGEGSAPAAVLLITVLAVGRGRISRVLSWRPLVKLGEASFALYLVHEPLLLLAHTPAGLAGYAVIVAATTWLAHNYVEQPGTRFANWILDRLASLVRPRTARNVFVPLT